MPPATLESRPNTVLLRLTRQAAAAPIADLTPYQEDVARTLDEGIRWPRFRDRLEALFEHETERARRGHLVAIGLVWIVMGLACAVAMRTTTGPSPFGMNPVVRAGVVTPILLAVTFAIWWGVRPFLREFLIMLACIVAPVSMILEVTFAQTGNLGANRGALTVVLLFITVVVRLRFWFAATACLTIVAVQVGVPLLLDVPLPGSVPLAVVTIVVTLMANYALEREYRLNFLQRLHGRIQGAQLAAMVDQLHDLSQRDPLTGLANRRAMDAQLEELCRQNARFAVILLDIDSFKAFNDGYGHQIGDDCLRRVAAMLRASLRRTSDRIARFGGEEFVVVLPETSLDDARTMAERMRNAVRDLRIPHMASPTARVVTISAGVCASRGAMGPAAMITQADQALYRAKALGRNRVEVSSDHVDALPDAAPPVALTA